MKSLKLQSIENAPLIRKFTILFVVMSLLPFVVIVYFYTQAEDGQAYISRELLFTLIFLLGIGALAGFYGMRRSIVKISRITKEAAKDLSDKVPTLKKLDYDTSEISQLVRTFNETTKSMEENIKRLEQSKHLIQDVLNKIATALTSSNTIDVFLDLIVQVITNALDGRIGVLMLFDDSKQELYVKSSSAADVRFKDMRIAAGEEGPGWVLKYRKPLSISALPALAQPEENNPFLSPLLCAPMLYKDKIIGVLIVSGKINGNSFQEDELLIVSNLAIQTAVAVENDRLHTDAEKTYLQTITALAMAVEARDPYSRGHSDRVALYSVKLAKKLGLNQDAIKDIMDAASLHDVGKIGISDQILLKPDFLTTEERKMMDRHPIIGESIIKPITSLSRLSSIVRHHHEWLDGTGYPDKLKGDAIVLGAKILGVTDSFDAMTTDRPYRKALTIEQAKEELKKFIGIRYDRKIVEAFLEVV